MKTSNKMLELPPGPRLQKLNLPKKALFKKKIGLSISLRLATIGRCFHILLRYTRHFARCHTRYRWWLFGWLFGDDTRGQGLETIPGVESHEAIFPPTKNPWEGSRTVCSPIDLSILSYQQTCRYIYILKIHTLPWMLWVFRKFHL